MPKKNRYSSIIVLLFLGITGFVAVAAFFKTFTSKQNYVYAKVKVSQGLWWAATKRPSFWLIENLAVGEQEKGITGRPAAELLGFIYYPHVARILDSRIVNPETTYNIYLDLKINAKRTKKGEYIFKRNAIAVGSPIEINFPSTHLTGTVIDLSEEPIKDEYVTQNVYLTGKASYLWEYDAIKIGDTYYNGKQEVFRVLNKQLTNPAERIVTVKARLNLKKSKNDKLFFGEEQEILIGAPFELITQKANYSFLVVSKLE